MLFPIKNAKKTRKMRENMISSKTYPTDCCDPEGEDEGEGARAVVVRSVCAWGLGLVSGSNAGVGRWGGGDRMGRERRPVERGD